MSEAQETVEVSVVGSIADVAASDWDACACPEAVDGRAIDPFTTHRFLKALEDSGSVGDGTGWQPRHVVARRGDQVIGVMPCYAKSHSQGEYIFDFNWAHAYENAGGRYYPKLQSAVPFTPATGRRFYWLNDGYADFDTFLRALSSRKRKAIRKERRVAQGFGGEIVALTGDQIAPEHWDAFWYFYQDTGMRKWGSPYLTRGFFECAQESLRDDILLVMCRKDGEWVAGALNFIGRDTLYGRYWGCIEDHPCLHFEVCYYQAIDYAIRNGMARVEAGAQGPHKLARGYLPQTVHSLHWIADPGFRDAVARFLEAERDAVDEEIEVMTSYGPFRKDTGEDDG